MDERIEAEDLGVPDGVTPGERLAVVRAVLARNLRVERVRHRVSRRDVIERTGMPSSRVTAIEAGRGNATIDDMARLAVLLETPLWKLLRP